jgi:hypothetical protein
VGPTRDKALELAALDVVHALYEAGLPLRRPIKPLTRRRPKTLHTSVHDVLRIFRQFAAGVVGRPRKVRGRKLSSADYAFSKKIVDAYEARRGIVP